MLLVGADEEGGGKGIEPMLAGVFRRWRQAKVEAILAALRLIASDAAEIFGHVVTISDCQRQVYTLRQGLHTFKSALMLGIGVDIRVVPETLNLIVLLAPVFHGIGGAMGAADMNQHFFHDYYISLARGV